MEEAATGDRGGSCVHLDRAAVGGVHADARVVPNHQAQRPHAVRETVRVLVARRRLDARRDGETVVGRVAVHRKCEPTFFGSGLDFV